MNEFNARDAIRDFSEWSKLQNDMMKAILQVVNMVINFLHSEDYVFIGEDGRLFLRVSVGRLEWRCFINDEMTAEVGVFEGPEFERQIFSSWDDRLRDLRHDRISEVHAGLEEFLTTAVERYPCLCKRWKKIVVNKEKKATAEAPTRSASRSVAVPVPGSVRVGENFSDDE